jgi:LmbE family N-acetylglucosaminyl deacetylase
VSAGPLERPGTALAIGAHPDDIEFGCGATINKWAVAGTDVHLAILTDGSKGTWNPDADLHELAKIREEEQANAASALGASEVHHLDFVDGELNHGNDERSAVVALIRAVRPDVVLGHDPWKRYRLHPDHREAGNLTLAALVAARDPHFFPDQGTPHRPTALLLFEAEEKDHFEPIEEEHFKAKLTALLCHRSQWHSTMGIEEGSSEEHDQLTAFAEQQRKQAEEAGERRNVRLAEGYKLMTDL